MTTGLIFHDDYLKHKPPENHPENPLRLSATMEHLMKTHVLSMVDQITPQEAKTEDVERVHSLEHINYIRCMSEKGHGRFAVIDPDTYVSPETYHVALLAAGGVMAAGEAVVKKEVENVFALVRPPGHHASRNQATGFCFFDNMSVMVKHLQAKHGVKKVCVFDWDAHAPNGTMGTFYSDPTVLNMSIHQDPKSFYPGVGFIDQIGEGAGRGYTINFPVPGGTGDADYIYFINDFVVPYVRKFKPDLIAIAAGQDSHASDRISQLNVTDAGYAEMTRIFMELADELCGGKLVLELEGGYNVRTLPVTHNAIISTLLGIPHDKKVEGKPLQSTHDLLTQLKNTLKTKSIWGEAPDMHEASEEDNTCKRA
ncbi:Histone deacetylase domain protein [uncultured archaeon]|nr:Histone deacetylase domain protein [uncultured archaeon]